MEKKMTKREMFAMIMAVEGVAQNEDMVQFLAHEIELLERKSSKSGQTKLQKENEVIKARILDSLRIIGRPVTISELQTEDVAMSEFQNQKLSALLKQMIESGDVVRTTDKKKAYFSIAKVDETEVDDEE